MRNDIQLPMVNSVCFKLDSISTSPRFPADSRAPMMRHGSGFLVMAAEALSTRDFAAKPEPRKCERLFLVSK
ncbi:hypothetical protein [Qipengyuania sp.]|uniref:hypothetical protein n=1 Tax=Qipengyuania sp. TaxID=2004515 RepID=UPI003515CFF9